MARFLQSVFGALLLSIVWPTNGSAAIFRVDLNATGQPSDGSSWTNAFRSITNALPVAAAGDEIWVAKGTYPGGIRMKSGVALYGGFAGTETVRTDRWPQQNETIIDGLGKTNGILFAASALLDTRVDGFTLRGCIGETGAAFRAVTGSPTIANNLVTECLARAFGSAVYLEASAAVVTNNVFSYNGSDNSVAGGAIFATNSTPRVEGNTFSGNHARDGGAILFVQTSGFIERNHFIANRAIRDGGAVLYLGASPRTAYNRFTGNGTGARGGALAMSGGGSSPLIFNNVLIRNFASLASSTNADTRGGGGLFIDTFSLPSVINNTFVSNSAPVGGLVCLNSTVTIANNLIASGSSGIGGADKLLLFNNNVFGNGGSNFVTTANPTGTGGNISADPKFGGATGLGVVNILPESPCRDTGNLSYLPPETLVDIDGKPRVQGASVDIGAAESDGVSTFFLPPVVRVAANGDDRAAGDSWTNPMRTVQSAVDRASRTGGEVWVRGANYTGSLNFRPFTYVYGGFGGSETNRNQRNWQTNATVLDALGQERVVTMTRLTLEETLDGFTIQNGLAVVGGGIFTDSSVRISHNRFASNSALATIPSATVRGGGAIYVAGGEPLILNNQFFRNFAASLERTQTAEGGAIKVSEGAPVIANNLFRQNAVTNAAVGGEARGGAISVVLKAAPQIINNTVLQSTATATSGNTILDGGALYFGNTNAPARVGNNLIAYNSSGIYSIGRVPELRNNLVFANIRTNYERLTDPTGTQGNLSISPRLTGPYGDPHLAPTSPCINAGDASLVQPGWTDLDDLARVNGASVDIGVDEFDGTEYTIADRIFYVRPDGDDKLDGQSWATARKTLQNMLLVAGFEGGEVWVKTGKYTNRFNAGTFTYVYGGFNGTETNRADRNWFANPTILDGNISGSPTGVVVGPPVVSLFGPDGYSALSGFTIQNGYGRQGGGILAHGSPRISDNVIRSNTVASTAAILANGAGIFSQGGSPLILNNLLVANLAVGSGTQSGHGGAIYLNPPPNAMPVIANNTVVNNFATNGGGAVFIDGGGTAQLVNNIITFNHSGIAAAAPATALQIGLRNNCLFGTTTNELVNVVLGANNVMADPRLVDWTHGSFRLRSDSPCFNAGDDSVGQSAFDIYGEARVAHGHIDIGADEFTGPQEADYSIVLTQPVQGAAAVAPATIPVAATVTGGTRPLAFVEFSANDQVIAITTNQPHSSFATGLLFGDYQVVAKVVTVDGSVKASAPVSLLVLLPPGNLPPTVAFSTPTNSQTFSVNGPTTVRTSFNFAKPNGSILNWKLLSGSLKLAENLNVPAGQSSATVTVPNLPMGQYTWTAIVQSSVGDWATNAVTFSIVQRPVVAAPVVKYPVFQPDGSVRIEMTLPTPGALYRLEKSINLTNWALITVGAGGSPNLVTNVAGTNLLQFFRGSGDYPN